MGTLDRILLVTRFVPAPAHTGALVYSAQLVRLLARLGRRVDVLCQAQAGQGAAEAARTVGFPDNVRFAVQPFRGASALRRALTGLPAAAVPHATPENRAALGRLLAEPCDAVVLDHLASCWALPQVLAARTSRGAVPRLIHTSHNVEYTTRLSIAGGERQGLPARLAHRLDAIRVRFHEGRLVRHAACTTAISQADAAELRRLYGARRVEAIHPVYEGAVTAARTIDASAPRRIGLVGSFLWSAKKLNLVSFLSAAAPRLAGSGVEILVIGNAEPAFLADMRARFPAVRFTGRVAEVSSHLSSCRIGVVPEEAGGGFKLKTLEYVFHRVPLFALSSALVDLPLRHGESVMAYPDMASLCHGMAEHVDDLPLLNRMQESAFGASSAFLSLDAGTGAFGRVFSEGP